MSPGDLAHESFGTMLVDWRLDLLAITCRNSIRSPPPLSHAMRFVVDKERGRQQGDR